MLPALIVNISSGGRIGLPYQDMYAASKGVCAILPPAA